MSSNIVCIYHDKCLDGLASAAVVYGYFNGPGFDIEFVPANYGDAPPDVTDKDVYIVDFSYSKETIISMAEKAKSIVILDHHKTAKEQLGDIHLANVAIRFDMSRSGAQVAWDYFNGSTSERPIVIEHVADRDLWKFENPLTKTFINYLRNCFNWSEEPIELIKKMDSIIYECSNTSTYKDRIKIGRMIEDSYNRQVEQIVSRATIARISNIQCCMFNSPPEFISDAGHELAKKHGVALGYYIDKDEVKFSLRGDGSSGS